MCHRHGRNDGSSLNVNRSHFFAASERLHTTERIRCYDGESIQSGARSDYRDERRYARVDPVRPLRFNPKLRKSIAHLALRKLVS